MVENIRFELKEIFDGKRDLGDIEKLKALEILLPQLDALAVGDQFNANRTMIIPTPATRARVLEGTLGISETNSKRWSEEQFDSFFAQILEGGAYYWFQPTGLFEFEPLFWAPYSSARRDYLYVYAMEWGMRPCGITRADGGISMLSHIDDNYTFVFGREEEMRIFEDAFGGSKKICEDLLNYLSTTEIDFGEGNVNGYLQRVLPTVGGCIS